MIETIEEWKNLIKNNYKDYIIITKETGCMYCTLTKINLDGLYTDITVRRDISIELFKEITNGAETVPQIFTKDGKLIGGYNAIKKELNG